MSRRNPTADSRASSETPENLDASFLSSDGRGFGEDSTRGTDSPTGSRQDPDEAGPSTSDADVPSTSAPRALRARIRKEQDPDHCGAPSRKRNKNKESEEIVLDAKNFKIRQNPGVVIPSGTVRKRFELKSKSVPDDDYMKDMVFLTKQEKITKNPVKKRKNENDEKKEDESEKEMVPIPVRIGSDYQIYIPDSPSSSSPARNDEDYDELMWKAPDEKEMMNGLRIPSTTPEIIKENYETILEKGYWRAIWVQYKGHIPQDAALTHLMECKYDLAEALKTIDKCLEHLPQRIKPLCSYQAKLLHNIMLKMKREETDKDGRVVDWVGIDEFSRVDLQRGVLKNYHAGEIEHIIGQFRRFYECQARHGIACMCHEPIMCAKVEFEPRWACTNCTKKKMADGTVERLCLICQTYMRLVKEPLPKMDVVFDDEDLKIMERWEAIELQENRTISREELEAIMKKEQDLRWLNGELTNEEKDIIDFKDLDPVKDAELICDRLQPNPLPLFTRCPCERTGVTYFQPEKKQVRELKKEDERNFVEKIVWCGGNLDFAAGLLKERRQLLDKFLEIYGEDHECWKRYAGNNFHKQKHVYCPYGMETLPKPIPLDDRNDPDPKLRGFCAKREDS